ncbi:MAG: hypothetical protein AB1726_14350 [Planctomycetota bacterium]
MAALANGSASEIDKTSFWWTGMCAICHPGGGPTEYDRDGDLYYDPVADQMGYEARGETADDQEFDGDYAEVSHMTGLERHPVPWNVTGVAEPDCLFCHRKERTIDTGKNMNWIWRAATLRAKDTLTDVAGGGGNPVPAFAAAATAGQGWFSGFGTATGVSPPLATHLVIDYSVGVADGSLELQADDTLEVNPDIIVETPVDHACWGCHALPEDKKRGRTWFDANEDVHFGSFNLRYDGDPLTTSRISTARLARAATRTRERWRIPASTTSARATRTSSPRATTRTTTGSTPAGIATWTERIRTRRRRWTPSTPRITSRRCPASSATSPSCARTPRSPSTTPRPAA